MQSFHYYCYIGRISKGGPADRCEGLHVGDQILSVNSIDITSLQHNEIVTLIRDSTETVSVRLMQRGLCSHRLFNFYDWVLADQF